MAKEFKDLQPPDPVFQNFEGWWFWNEVWVDRYGPFETEEECRLELEKYCKALDTI